MAQKTHSAIDQQNLPLSHSPTCRILQSRVDLHVLEALNPLICLPCSLLGMPVAANYLAMAVALSLPPLIAGNPLSVELHLKKNPENSMFPQCVQLN